MKAVIILAYASLCVSANDLPHVKITYIPENCSETAQHGEIVIFSYSAYLTNGSLFDSSNKQHGGPVSYTIGSGEASPEFDSGLIGMCRGESRQVTLSSDQGYNYQGPEGILPPEEKVRFDIDLVEIMKKKALFRQVDANEDGQISRDEIRDYMWKMFQKRKEKMPNLKQEDIGGDQEETLDQIFKEEDLDNDGVISYDEFTEAKPHHQEL